MKCPKCGLYNPDNAMFCDCGYNFDTMELDRKNKLAKNVKWYDKYGLIIALAIILVVIILISLVPLLRYLQSFY
jgi:uncharacterized membrane protein YvbJ